MGNKGFEVRTTHLELPGLPSGLRQMKVVHLSDLHNMYFDGLAENIIQLSPDFIFATGDFCDRRMQCGDSFISLLKQLSGRFPVYFSLGNHETEVRESVPEYFGKFIRQICALGVTLLDNESLRVSFRGTSFYLYGFSFANTFSKLEIIKRTFGACPKDAPVFVLCHHPKWFDDLVEWGAAAVFAGHIHGGLIRLPLIGGVLSPSLTFFPKYDKGVYRISDAFMSLSAGFGNTKLKLRINNPREIVLCTFETSEVIDKAKNIRRGIRYLLSALFIALGAINLIPVSLGIFGALLPLVINFAVAAVLLYPQILRYPLKNRHMRLLRALAIRLTALGIIFAFLISCFMIKANFKTPSPNSTVIILGCKVNGSEPSLMLSNRIHAALKYLKQNPDSIVIASGGQGPHEDIPEAQAIRNELVNNGISPSRIWMEDISKSTRQNLEFSAMMINDTDVNSKVVIATDEFHQLRSSMIASKFGLKATPAASKSPWYLLQYYWIREIFAVVKDFFLTL